METALKRLRRSPDAVIDIGVRYGTPWLYRAFRDTRFLLVDPQEGGDRLLTSRPAEYMFINKAVGRRAGKRVLNEQGLLSTFLERTALTAVPTQKTYEVEIVTLDDIIAQNLEDTRKIGVKIDTEGFELEVLVGLDIYVDRVEFIVSEVSVLNRFVDSYTFSDLVSEMQKKKFRFYNIVGSSRDPAPRLYDCLFLHEGDAAFR